MSLMELIDSFCRIANIVETSKVEQCVTFMRQWRHATPDNDARGRRRYLYLDFPERIAHGSEHLTRPNSLP